MYAEYKGWLHTQQKLSKRNPLVTAKMEMTKVRLQFID
jgi:hypothetical protein